MVIRWINLYIFYRKLAYEEAVNPEDIPDLYKIIKKFAEKIHITPPAISLTHRNHLNPFVIGIKSHLVVLSPILIDSLLPKEKDILIKHELSHIKRKDNLIGWIALILRDLLIFNPFAHIAYNLIKLEQEIGSDKIVLKFSNYSNKEIAKNMVFLILKIKQRKYNRASSSISCQYMLYEPFKKINFLILNYRIKSIFKTNIKKIEAKKVTRIFSYLIFLFLLLIQIVLIIKTNSNFLLLR
jgi:beta-lactamase regulating signal transducer with metallopeptidase domain